MNAHFKLIFADKITKWGLILSCFLLISEILYVALFYFSLPPLLPVFNQMPWGEERLGSRIEIFIPIFVAVIFVVVNFVVLTHIYEKAPLLSRMLSITTFLTTLLSFIFVIRTVYLLI